MDALRSLFLEEPWPLVVGAVALSAAALLICKALGKPAFGLVASGLLVATALLGVVLSLVVTTDHEQVRDRLRGLMSAASPYDVEMLNAIAADNLRLTVAGQGGQGRLIRQRPALDEWLEEIIDRFGLREHRVWSQQTRFISDSRAVTEAEIRTYVDVMGVPARTWWEIHWEQRGARGWQVIEMRWMRSAEGVPAPGTI